MRRFGTTRVAGRFEFKCEVGRLESDLGQAGREENTLEQLSHPLEELVHVGPLQHGHLPDRHTQPKGLILLPDHT